MIILIAILIAGILAITLIFSDRIRKWLGDFFFQSEEKSATHPVHKPSPSVGSQPQEMTVSQKNNLLERPRHASIHKNETGKGV